MDTAFGKFFLLFCAIYGTVYCVIPSYIKVCPHDHPDLAACIIESIDFLRPKLIEGIEELGIPALEPFHLPPITIDSVGGGTRLATNITNIIVTGPSNFKILKLTPKLTKKGYSFQYEVNIPQIRLVAEYELDSKILFLDLKGRGPFYANVSNYHFDCLMKGKKVKVAEDNHLLFDKMECQLDIGETKVLLGNLFEQNPALGNATNDVINDNIDVLFNEIKPGLESAISSRFTDIANNLTLAFKYEELFP